MRTMTDIECREAAKRLGCVVIIPTYNNAATIRGVIEGVAAYVDDIMVVNDGSTDATGAILEAVEGIEVISYDVNRGKGYALRTGLRAAAGKGFRYAITIDSDGQHYASDIPCFLSRVEDEPDSLIVGARNLCQENMPSKNSFANRFSNFWFRLETGKKLSDTQSGFRLYPLDKLKDMKFVTSRYEFELEILVRAAWRGVNVVDIPIQVYYAPDGERVSHFKPARDFMRISVLNSVLVIIALLVYYPVRFVKWFSFRNLRELVRKHITHSAEPNYKVGLAIGYGIFWGIVPLWGYQMILAGVTAHFLKLNKVIVIISSNISIPPMIPFILYGSYVAGGLVLGLPLSVPFAQMSFEMVGTVLVQYVVGSFVLALAAGIAGALVSYPLLAIFRKEPGA